MTDLIFITMPWLWAAPAFIFVLSALTSVFRVRPLSIISILIHAWSVSMIISLGGGLTDIFFLMLVSLLGAMLFAKFRRDKNKRKDGDKQ